MRADVDTPMTHRTPAVDPATLERVVVLLLCGFYGLLLIRTAWLSDDAYITLRIVYNALHGYGLRWNVDERVQADTHPLWMFVLMGASAISREYYWSAILASLITAMAGMLVYLTRVARGLPQLVIGGLMLLLSKAFIDFSTSGLEDPLTMLLLGVFFAYYWKSQTFDRRTVYILSIVAGLCAFNRENDLLLIAPALALVVVSYGVGKSILPVVAGFTPLAGWTLFSLVYFGFPFPNTAYSKLGGALPLFERVEQGFYYLFDSIKLDPITLIVIAAAALTPIYRRSRRELAVVAGILMTMIYVVVIGGDFMSGRFLNEPFFVAVVLLTQAEWFHSFESVPAVSAVIVVIGLSSPWAPLLTDKTLKHDYLDRDGVVDERRVYYPFTGLLNVVDGSGPWTHKWAQHARDVLASGARVTAYEADGFFGFTLGPTVHSVDKFGITDPLLARLPAGPAWRPGHLDRRIPEGYLETIETGHNVIRDPLIATYYEHLRVVTQAPLFTRRRLREIWRFNTGTYDDLIASSSYGPKTLRQAEFAIPPPPGTSAHDSACARVDEGGVQVILDRKYRNADLEVGLDGDDYYLLQFMNGAHEVGHTLVQPQGVRYGAPPVTYRVHAETHGHDFDRVLVSARLGLAPYTIAFLKVLDADAATRH